MTRLDDIHLEVAGTNGKPQRVVVALAGPVEHRDHIDTNSALSRKRFIAALAGKLGIDAGELAGLDTRLVTAADEADAELAALRSEAGGGGDDSPRQSQATRLVDLVRGAGAELFHDAAGECFATIPVAEHLETHRLRTKAMRQWMARLYHREAGTVPGAQALTDALNVLEGMALHEGDEHDVHLRLAEHDGRIYLDLGDADWRAVEIDGRGWRIVDAAPVRFRRAKAMLALPTPERGGTVDELRRFVNIGDDHWPLILAWQVAALRPRGPYPILCLHGEQGSAKSTTARLLRSLVDPNTAPLRSEPREPRDLMIAASNGWTIALDNLSLIPGWLSDALCRLSTGGGFATRTLYENDEETIFNATRPILITGIEELASRGDLIDRALIVPLVRIEPTARRREQDVLDTFSEAQPRILGALLTAVSKALGNLSTTKLDALPRMADFALWASAAEPALGLTSGEFIDAYETNRDSSNELALEASPVASVVLNLMAEIGGFHGTIAALLTMLDERADERAKRQRAWPKSSRALSGTLRRLAPNLRDAGLDVEFSRDTDRQRRRMVSLTPVGTAGDSSVRTVRTDRHDEQSDAADDADASLPAGSDGWDFDEINSALADAASDDLE